MWGEYCAAGESIYWCILLVERDANGSNLTNEKPPLLRDVSRFNALKGFMTS